MSANDAYGFPGRTLVALATLAFILLVVGFDLAASGAVDPFDTPPPIALGSGLAPGGAHCTGL
jgi:hypothetical protein